MRLRSVHTYVGLMIVTALVCLTLLDWTTIQGADWVGLTSLILLGIFSESAAINVTVARSVGHSSITFIPFLATVLLFGPAAGVLLAAAIMVVGEFVLHDKPRVKAIFNVSQWIVVSAASGAIFSAIAGVMDVDLDANLITVLPDTLLPFGALVLALFSLNYLFVAGAIALDKQLGLSRVIQMLASSAGANLLFGVLVSPIAIIVAILYEELNVMGLFISLLPLIFIRRSYLNNLRLQKANRDLLRALVKAIETRDPYTSGHSLRVSALATRIAVGLGLSERKIEDIETAALLHDIGKIEAVYTEILRKPSALSPEEREIIKSHVTKGVELLESISSFPPAVIAAVRHHHEREDGKGYPDQLHGDEIPLGAKIIKVCDAIDAMLSDRPYRRALSLAQVREQLVTYAGTQFDVRLVGTIIRSEILEEHQEEVQAAREWSAAMIEKGMVDVNPKSGDFATAFRSILAVDRPGILRSKKLES